mmetsp:Transcript_19204/g.45265  ORF Transcript_19204/g.45265 Transcript_19204/m.45265 type:complete len:85 (+) Transcript_19204:1530-1784(+)
MCIELMGLATEVFPLYPGAVTRMANVVALAMIDAAVAAKTALLEREPRAKFDVTIMGAASRASSAVADLQRAVQGIAGNKNGAF